MSLVGVLDVLIVGLLAALVVLEILRPRRMRALMDEVDRRTEAATEALDAAQRRLERTMEGLAGEEEGAPPPREEARWDRAEGGAPSRGREPEADAGEPIELDAALPRGPSDARAHSLREKIAALLEHSASERTERERRLLRQLQDTLERPPGADRYEQEKALYQALEAAAEEAGPRPAGEPPDEERELIAKLRRDAHR